MTTSNPDATDTASTLQPTLGNDQIAATPDISVSDQHTSDHEAETSHSDMIIATEDPSDTGHHPPDEVKEAPSTDIPSATVDVNETLLHPPDHDDALEIM